MNKKKTLYLIDGHALVYRSHYAFIRRPLINSKGINTSAISGFVRTIWEILNDRKPDSIAVVFDPSGPTFRHEEYELYKANRDKQPEDIQIAIPYIKRILEGFRIPVIVVDRYEADDVIGTIALKAAENGMTAYMVTPDKDYGQLVSDDVLIYKPMGNGEGHEVLGPNDIKKKWGIENTAQVVDFLAIQGDSSDNIPGVKGIGEKGTQKLIEQYGSLENIYENLKFITGRNREYLENSREQAFFSKYLATIKKDVPIEIDFKKFEIEPFNNQALSEVFKELEFRSMAKMILGEDKQEIIQTSIFDSFQKSEEIPFDQPEKTEYQIASKNFHNSSKKYFLADNEEKIKELVKKLATLENFAFDTETSELDPNLANLVGISVSFIEDEAYYIPVRSDNIETVLNTLKPVLENEKIGKTGQNCKYDILVMKWHGIDLKGPLFDTMIGHYLIEPELRHKLDYLSETYLNYKMIPIEDLIGKKGRDQLSMADIDIEKVRDYAAEDADITLQLRKIIKTKLEEDNLLDVFFRLEMPLIKTLVNMEYNGVYIDVNFLKDYSTVLEEQILKSEKEIYDKAGVRFNIASPKQVGEVLFEKLKIPYRWTKTSTEQYSTSEEKLTELGYQFDIVNDILNFRKLQKLKNTYVDSLPKLVNPKTGRIHSSFNQARAATGRLSSENPNLQNIPIKDEAGREIRKAFKPRDKDHLILSADYSQIELRLIADMSDDQAMLEAFNNDLDIHKATAAKIFDVPLEEVSPEQRRQAKTINFSIVYGAGSTNLSRQLAIPKSDAKKLIDNYFEEYKGLNKYFEDIVQFARANGYVMTKMGRKRKLRDINSRNSLARSNAERMAINTPVQGTAADMIKIAMININEEINEKGLKSKMILQVHDELVFDMHITEKDILPQIVREKMENAIPGLKVKIKVDTGSGDNWLEAH
ncbi:MAG: DNA polymerase I [Deltaproteobacteria bacterium]